MQKCKCYFGIFYVSGSGGQDRKMCLGKWQLKLPIHERTSQLTGLKVVENKRSISLAGLLLLHSPPKGECFEGHHFLASLLWNCTKRGSGIELCGDAILASMLQISVLPGVYRHSDSSPFVGPNCIPFVYVNGTPNPRCIPYKLYANGAPWDNCGTPKTVLLVYRRRDILN